MMNVQPEGPDGKTHKMTILEKKSNEQQSLPDNTVDPDVSFSQSDATIPKTVIKPPNSGSLDSEETITPMSLSTASEMLSLRQRFSFVFGIPDNENDQAAQGMLASIDLANSLGNGARKIALAAAVQQIVGSLPASIESILAMGLEKNPDNLPAYLRLVDGKQLFCVQRATAGGQGAVHIVVNPSLTPTDPDLFQVAKIMKIGDMQVTIHQKTFEFVPLNGGHHDELARFNTEAAILKHIENCGLSHITARLLDRTMTVEGAPVLISEFIRGRDLNTFIKHGQKLPPQAMYDMMAYLAALMDKLHTMEEDSDGNVNGIVHRDLKPANIMLTSTGKMKVVDFGLGKYRGQEAISIANANTHSKVIAGTGAYMAPEQFGDMRHASYAADVYSLAATFTHLTTGSPVYPGDNILQMGMRHADPLLRPTAAMQALLDEGIDPKIVELFQRCLRKTTETDTSGNLRLSRHQIDRPTMMQVFEAVAPHTSWSKESRNTTPSRLFEGIHNGSVSIQGLLSNKEMRSIGIDRPFPDGYEDSDVGMIEAIQKQYPVQAIRSQTKAKLSRVLGGAFASTVLAGATALTVVYMMRDGTEIDNNAVSVGQPDKKSSSTNAPNRRTLSLFEDMDAHVDIPEVNYFSLNSTEGEIAGYAGRLDFSTSGKLLGLPRKELNPNFIKNGGTTFLFLINKKNETFFFAPGVGCYFCYQSEKGTTSAFVDDSQNDKNDFPTYNPRITIKADQIRSFEDLFTSPEIDAFFSALPEVAFEDEKKGICYEWGMNALETFRANFR